MQILDKYLDDNNVEITFYDELTKMHINELLYFKNISLPNYLKLFYEQTNGLLIESSYLVMDPDEVTHLLINSLENLFFTQKKLNALPENRFINFGTNDDEAIYLIDTSNNDPNGNPLILLNIPSYNFCIPLTNSFDIFLECACLGIFGLIEFFAMENEVPPERIPKKMFRKKDRILACLKELFETAKREYALLDVWHLPDKTKLLIQASIANWFKEIKRLLTIFK